MFLHDFRVLFTKALLNPGQTIVSMLKRDMSAKLYIF